MNYLYLGAIRRALPEANILLVRRQPLDSCVQIVHLERDVVHYSGRTRRNAWRLHELQAAVSDAQERQLLVAEVKSLGHLQAKDLAIKRNRSLQARDV